MTRTIKEALADGDVTMMLFEPFSAINEVEKELIASLQKGSASVAVINKTDILANEDALTNKTEELKSFGVFETILSTSAVSGSGCDELLNVLRDYAVDGPHYFMEDDYTDQPEKQLVAELIREKLLLNLQQEIPHGTAVEIERFREREGSPVVDIDATIYCEKKSHKGMIIGKGGQMLKTIASAARADVEEMLGTKVNLQCWVKVKESWRDNDTLLNHLGFKKNV